jgi:MFS family permease
LEANIDRLQRLINRLPGPGKLIFGALVADRTALRVLVACMGAVFATSLQPPVLSLYTPDLQQGLRDPGSGAPLLVAAGYLLLAVLTLVGGASGDIFGHKRFLLLGLGGVLVTDVLGMLWLDTPQYALANALNTISSVLVIPMTVSLVTLAFPIQARPFAYGAIFGTQGVGLIGASSIYGIAVQTQWEWAAFLPAIALTVAAMRFVSRDTTESRAPRGASRLELFLNVGWASAIFALVYGLLALGGGLTELNLFLIVAICVLGFVIAYRWVARRTRGSTIRLYGIRDLSLAILAGIALSVGQSSLLYQFGTFFQKIQGIGPVAAGLRMLPFVLAMIIATFFIVRLSLYFGARRLIAAGLVLMAIGMATLYFLQPDTPYWTLIVPFLIMGFGFGIATPARTVVVLTTPPATFVGMAAGVNGAAGQSGFALGTILSSVLVTLFAHQHALDQLQQSNAPPQVVQAVSAVFDNVFSRVISGDLTRVPDNVAAVLVVPFGQSFSVGLSLTFFVIAVLLVISAVVIFFGMSRGLKGTLIDQPLNPRQTPPAPETPAPTASELAAFSPTDTLPLSRATKVLSMTRSSISLIAIVVVAGTAINILAGSAWPAKG